MSIISRALAFSIPKVDEEWYYFQEDHQLEFYNRLHFHPELQITLMVRGDGTFICGDYLNEFHEGDVYVFGSNVSHVFRNSVTEEKAQSFSLFLETEKFSSSLFPTEVREGLLKFRNDSLGGLKVAREKTGQISGSLNRIKDVSGLLQIAAVMELLNYLIQPMAYEILSLNNIEKPARLKSDQRMNEVIQFTLENYIDEISLEEIAKIAFMTKSSFCRYFKQHTRKTYSEYLAEIRINHACQLLRNNKLSIRDICFESGYSNISHFNRKFRALKKITPSHYRKQLVGREQ